MSIKPQPLRKFHDILPDIGSLKPCVAPDLKYLIKPRSRSWHQFLYPKTQGVQVWHSSPYLNDLSSHPAFTLCLGASLNYRAANLTTSTTKQLTNILQLPPLPIAALHVMSDWRLANVEYIWRMTLSMVAMAAVSVAVIGWNQSEYNRHNLRVAQAGAKHKWRPTGLNLRRWRLQRRHIV